MSKIADLRGKNQTDLKALLKTKHVDLVKLREELMLGKNKKASESKNLKKEIARIQTVLREKEIIEELA